MGAVIALTQMDKATFVHGFRRERSAETRQPKAFGQLRRVVRPDHTAVVDYDPVPHCMPS